MKFSLVIPAKNEEKRIILPLLDYYSALTRRFGTGKFEIIVVVNNTSDNTVGTLKTINRILGTKEIRVFDIGAAEAKGRAVVFGLRQARGKVVGFTDADGSYKASEIMKMFRKLDYEKADAIIPNRYSKNSLLIGELPWDRRVFSRIFNFAIRQLFGLPFRDTQGGVKLFTKKTIMAMLPELVTFGWTCDVNMLVSLKEMDAKILETSIEWSQQAGSHLSIVRNAWGIVKEVGRLIGHKLTTKPISFINVALPTSKA